MGAGRGGGVWEVRGIAKKKDYISLSCFLDMQITDPSGSGHGVPTEGK